MYNPSSALTGRIFISYSTGGHFILQEGNLIYPTEEYWNKDVFNIHN